MNEYISLKDFPKNLELISFKMLENQIIHVEFCRENKMNAMNIQFFKELQQILTAIKDTNEIKCVILTARGKHFTAGLDLNDVSLSQFGDPNIERDAARKGILIYKFLKQLQQILNLLEEINVPIIAGIHSACIGAGLDLTNCCDIRYCTKDSFFSIKEIDIGICSDLGTMQRMPYNVSNSSMFREVAYTGENFNSQQALQMGYVSYVFDSKEEMLRQMIKTSSLIAQKSPIAIYTIKKTLNFGQKGNINRGLEFIAQMNSCMLQTDDVQKQIIANLQKKSTNFPKL